MVHARVVALVEKYNARFLRLENKHVSNVLIIRKVFDGKAGRPVEEYMLNEGQTIFLGSLFRNSNDEILDFKEKVAGEFIRMKDELRAKNKIHSSPEYHVIRNAGKIVRHETTAIMSEFMLYAIQQGSTHPERYYSNFTKMANSLLFIVEGKFKNLREVMTVQQLMTTGSAEQIIGKGIREGMNKKMFYKDIYLDVKGRVAKFAELNGKSEVIDRQMLIE